MRASFSVVSALSCVAVAVALIGACSSAEPTHTEDDDGGVISRRDGSAGDDAGDPGDPLPDPKPTCTDGIKNGDETDVDCGGSCLACKKGEGCVAAKDCAAAATGGADALTCASGTCCRSYTKMTGSVSGSGEICCDGSDKMIAPVVDCAVGSNHTATAENASCAKAAEGAGNNGNACAQITCGDCARPKDAGAD